MSLGVVGAQILVLGLFFMARSFRPFISRHILLLGFLATLIPTLGSLFYSMIAHFPPCDLCWWQRIFLYPQVILFGLALYKKYKKGSEDTVVLTQSLVLSLIGAAIALYHYIGQFIPSVLPACSATGISCSKLYFETFGYINIPMMSLTAFLFVITLVLVSKTR